MKTTILAASLPSSFLKWRSVVAILVAICCFGAIKVQASLVGWDFSLLAGGVNNFGASPLTPTDNDANLTIGGLTRGSGIGSTGTGAAKAWGGNGFTTANNTEALAISGNQFGTLTITANSGYQLSFDSISAYNIRRSSTGPTTGIWQYEVGGGAFTDIGSAITWGSTTTAAGNSQSAITLSGISDLQNVAAGTTITFRIVDWGSSGTGGTWYLNDTGNTTGDDLSFNGTLTAVPEPVTWALIVFGALFGAVQLGRLYRRHLAAC